MYTEIIALCDYASVSREGKLNINGIFDELRVQKFPGGIARAFLVATIHGEPDTSYALKLALEQEGKTDNPIKMKPMSLDTHTGANGKNNIITEFVNITFEIEGDFRFVIYHGDDIVGTTHLKVMYVQQAQEARYKLPN